MSSDLLLKALQLLQKNKPGPATALVRKQLHLTPNNFNAQHLMGVLLLKQQRHAEAVSALSQAIKLPAPEQQRAQALNNLCLALQGSGRLVEARSLIDQAIALCPTDPAFYCNRANLHAAVHDYPQMETDFAKALNLDASLSAAALGLAIAQRKQNKHNQALTALNLISDADQDFDWLSEWALIQGVLTSPSALSHTLKSFALDSDQLRDLADYLAEEGYTELATPLYQCCLDGNPDDLTAQHMLAAIRGDQSARAPADYIESLYDRCASEFEQRLVETLGYDAPGRATGWLQQLHLIPADNVLDLGCGTGLMGHALNQVEGFTSLTGVDLSRNMLALAADKQCYSQLFQADILSWTPPHRFDLICAMDLLIYLGDLQPLFNRISDWLEPGGHFICTLELNSEQTPRLQPSGRFQHSLDYLRQITAGVGLKISDQQTFPLRREGSSTLMGAMLVLNKEG